MKGLSMLCAALVLSGCFELDAFLYEPKRAEAYLLEPAGKTPEETVTADRIEPLLLTVSEEVTLGAAYVKASAQPPAGHVLHFHGRGGNLDSHFGEAKRLSNMGFDVLTFDYRGWGTSTDVTPTERGIEEDTRAARQWLVDRAGTTRLVYFGKSFGTATAAQRAEVDPPVAWVLESGFASIEQFGRDSSQMDLPSSFFAADGWDTERRVARVEAPVLFIHGTADDFVRPEFSKRMFGKAHEPKELVLVEGAEHGNVATTLGGPEYAALVGGFFRRYLP